MSLRAPFREEPPRLWPRWRGSARGVGLTARVGSLLGTCFAICFVTGLLSHYQYDPRTWLPVSATPSWGYRVTQGLHVITGIALIPLLLVKLWSVFPRLFVWPPVRGLVHSFERLSVAVLVSSALVEVTTGYLNVLTWYPWPWVFVPVHYWLAWVVAGSIVLHVAVQLPAIRRGLAERVDTADPPDDGPGSVPVTAGPTAPAGGISRRGVLVSAGAAFGVVALTTAGQSVPALRGIGVLRVRQPERGPSGIPINRTAVQAQVTPIGPDYRLRLVGPTSYDLDLDALERLATEKRDLPIACVEGWSAGGTWTGPRLLDLVERAGGSASSTVRVTSLERAGAYRSSLVEGPHLRAALVATHLNGQRLSLDHGHPARLIAPDRAGVLNTKWLTEIRVMA